MQVRHVVDRVVGVEIHAVVVYAYTNEVERNDGSFKNHNAKVRIDIRLEMTITHIETNLPARKSFCSSS